MNFTTNHDENSWKGTVKETFGDADKLMAVLSYVMPGMPLIYSGQEYDLNHRLKFFEKDSVSKIKGKYFELYSKLKEVKTKNPALHGGKEAASYHRIKTSDDKHILAFSREKKGKKIVFIANFSNVLNSFTIDYEGKSKDYFTGSVLNFQKNELVSLSPWSYLLFEN